MNHRLVASSGTPAGAPGDPFERDTVLILTAHAETEARIRAALTAEGIPAAILNTLVVPAAELNLGLEAKADTLSFLMRVARIDDLGAQQTYFGSIPYAVFRVTPSPEQPPSPLARPPYRTRGTGTSEAHLSESLDALEAALRARYAPLRATRLPVHFPKADIYSEHCLSSGRLCAADTRDTAGGASQDIEFADSADDFYVVFGVNHAAAGKASYSNFILYSKRGYFGVEAIDDQRQLHSARDYLPDDPNVDLLYAWKVARQCGADPHCLPVAATCPEGILPGETGRFNFRAYLEPGTRVAPAAHELLTDRVIHFSP
ncbi:MAG: hypothetical protein L0Y32_06345 [Nevskiales bacterium]|nr:hypothetical protein [Nevskiales bacterium]